MCVCVNLFHHSLHIYKLAYLFIYLSEFESIYLFMSLYVYAHTAVCISPSHHHFRLLALLCPQRWTQVAPRRGPTPAAPGAESGDLER